MFQKKAIRSGHDGNYTYKGSSTEGTEAELQQPCLFKQQKEPETMNELTHCHTNDISKWNTEFY